MTLYLGVAVFVTAMIALIYLFLISPRLSSGADMEPLDCDYAHRGLWSEHLPENSLSAFEAAARRGFGIELDIRLTKDKRIVVFHDDDLRRMCGVNKRVCELTLSELRALSLKGTRERIPTLSEVLRLIDGRVPLLIEVKGEAEPLLCRRASALLDTYSGAFCVESFSPIILRWFKKYRPSYPRGQLVTGISSVKRKGRLIIGFVLSNMLANFISRPDFIAIHQKKKRNLGFILCTRAFHAKGFIWTVRTPAERASCRRLGYHTIFEKFIPKEEKRNGKML